MNDKDESFKGYRIHWVQGYSLSHRELEILARKLMAELEEEQLLEESGYADAKQVINHIKSL